MKLIFDYLNVFPDWMKSIIVLTWGLAAIVLPLYCTSKILQKPEMKSAYTFLLRLCSKLVKSLGKQLDDPIKHPRLEKIFWGLNIIFSYLFSAVLFFIFATLALAFSFSSKKLSLYEHALFFSYMLLTIICAKAIKAKAGRDLVKARNPKKIN